MTETFIFDTNTLISAFLFWNSTPKKAYNKAVTSGKLVASDETYSEFKNVFSRSKFEKYISYEDRQLVIGELEEILVFAKIKEVITVCRDPKDDKYLELATASKASCIISGDKDLLVLHPFRGIPILTASDFLNTF